MKSGTQWERAPEERPGGGWRRAGGSLRAWWLRWWRPLLCEVLCGLNMELVARMAQLPHPDASGRLVHPPTEHGVTAFGALVLANIHMFGRISGGYSNPAIALAAAIAGRVPWTLAAAYAACECLGATLGFALTHAIAPADRFRLLPSPCSEMGPMLSTEWATSAGEFSLAMALALFACSAWRPAGGPDAPAPAKHPVPPPDHFLSLKFGLLFYALTYAAAWTSGASVNPARAIAAALWQGCWRLHWIYWVGPMSGAAAGAALYRYVLAPIPPHRKREFLY